MDCRVKPRNDAAERRAHRYPATTAISPLAFLAGFTVMRTSWPSAVKNAISRPTEKFPARLRIGDDAS